MKKISCLMIILLVGLTLVGCSYNGVVEFSYSDAVVKSINKVDLFPDMPASYSYFDYNAMAQEIDRVVFGFANTKEAKPLNYKFNDMSSWAPIGFWSDMKRQPSEYNPLVTGYMKRSFGLPTYIGDTRIMSADSEPITTIPMVLGSSYAGIDKSKQVFGDTTYNFAEMTMRSYNTGNKLIPNVGAQGQSFWYDLFPQIMFARLFDMYQQTPFMKEMVLNGANEWLEALPNFVKDGKPNYEFVGYDVVNEAPTLGGNHIEPPNGGLSFLFYSAYEISKDSKYLYATKTVLDYLQTYEKNPNYEAMTDYAPFVAAALNSRYNFNYDVGKFLDFIFEGDSAFRPGWTVMNGNMGGHSVDGLVGQSGDYAFSMNSFHLASVLAPLTKYDDRYATSIGKYILNLVNNAKVFFPHNLSLDNQTMNGYLPFDNKGSLCYEGFRNTGVAMGDATAMFGQPCDISLYSSAFVGALGGIVKETNVNGILQVDLNKTDSFGENTYGNYLYYNPYTVGKTVRFSGSGRYDLFDTVTKRFVARNVSGSCNIAIPANSSRVITVLPANSKLVKQGNKIMLYNVEIARYSAAVNIKNMTSRQELTASSNIELNYFAPSGDEVTNMKIYFNDIEAYNGSAISVFNYDKAILPDTDYTMKIEITTKNGLKDYCTKRVVCR